MKSLNKETKEGLVKKLKKKKPKTNKWKKVK